MPGSPLRHLLTLRYVSRRNLLDVNGSLLFPLLNRQSHINSNSVIWLAISLYRSSGICVIHPLLCWHCPISIKVGSSRRQRTQRQNFKRGKVLQMVRLQAVVLAQSSAAVVSSSCIQAAAAEVHTLPDGQSITIEDEGQRVAQAILNPVILNKDLPDLPAATVTQIMQHPDAATRKVSQYATCMYQYSTCNVLTS